MNYVLLHACIHLFSFVLIYCGYVALSEFFASVASAHLWQSDSATHVNHTNIFLFFFFVRCANVG